MVGLHPGALAQFIRATAVLAMSAPDQERWLNTPSGSMHVDELALDWDGGWRLLEQWVELDWLSADDAALFRPINGVLAEMSGKANAGLWTIDSLYRAQEWVRVRDLAIEALLRL